MLLEGLSIVVLGPKPARGSTLRAAKRAVAGLALMIAATSETVAHAESGTVGAQTDEQRSGARAAATAGGQAFRDGRWSDSVDLFTRAESVIHSPVHVLFLARAYEKLGKLVKAREAYRRITNEQLPASAPDPWRGAKAEAEKESDALEPRVPYVTVAVHGAGAAPVTVTMDGVSVLAAFLGVPQPVDPGEHRFEAAAEGMAPATGHVTAREAQRATVELALHAATPGAQVPGANPRSASAPAPHAPPPEADTQRGVSPLTWAAFGLGAVGLGVGTAFALKSSSKLDDANGLCALPGSACPDDRQGQINSLDDSARSAKTIAIVGFVAGGVGVATGVTLLLVSSTPKHASATVAPWIGLRSAGVSGRF